MPPASRDGCNYPDARKRRGTSVAKIGRKQCHDCTFSTTTFVPVKEHEFISYERRKNSVDDSVGSERFDVPRSGEFAGGKMGGKNKNKNEGGSRRNLRPSRKFLSIKPSPFRRVTLKKFSR